MFAQAYRLRHEKDIKALFAKGKSVFGMSLGLKYRKNTSPNSRFTVVVGSKVSKLAVDRNRLKRRLRGILEKHLPELASGYDVMVLTKKEALQKPTAELEAQTLSLLKRTPLLPK